MDVLLAVACAHASGSRRTNIPPRPDNHYANGVILRPVELKPTPQDTNYPATETTKSMNRKQRSQISRWIETGEHVIPDAYCHASPDEEEDVRIEYVRGESSSASHETVVLSIYESSQDQFVGEEGDVLLPSPAHITINLGRAVSDQLVTWICSLLAPQPRWRPSDGVVFLPLGCVL